MYVAMTTTQSIYLTLLKQIMSSVNRGRLKKLSRMNAVKEGTTGKVHPLAEQEEVKSLLLKPNYILPP